MPHPPRSPEAPDARVGRRLGNRYRLDGVIGKGSMGTVFAATDEVLHRRVAIKEIDFPPGMPDAEMDQLERRTLREARAIAALSNPYVITLFDILTLPTGPVIVMELLRARSLAEIIKQVGRLPDGQAATVGVAVASGLLAAHAAGITHRDVKPGNVLICDDGRIKLTDFGIARSAAEQTMTATGLLLGSPAYIAPEVAGGTPAGPGSDAWSLGGLLYACVEGRPPFDQGTAIATLTSVVKDPVPQHPHSGRLGGVISGLLVKTPGLRMRTDRALGIMRGIADDPSGTHLALVDALAGPAPGTTGAIGPGPGTQLPALPGVPGPPGAPPPPFPPPGMTPAPSARSATHGPPLPPPGAASYGQRGFPPPPAAGPGPHPTAGPPAGFAGTLGPGPAPHLAPPPPGTGAPWPAPGVGPGHPGVRPAPALPPPPWAGLDSAALPPLPDQSPARGGGPPRWRAPAAVLVALLAAVAGFFGVRAIADLASSDRSAPVVAPPTVTEPARS